MHLFHTVSDFSVAHCIAICAFLVPANLLTTCLTLVLAWLGRSRAEVRAACTLASLCAGTMLLHVFTWFALGVVMAPTFILLALATVCLGLNFWIATRRTSLQVLLRTRLQVPG